MPHDTQHTQSKEERNQSAREKQNCSPCTTRRIRDATAEGERERVGEGIWQRQLRQQQNEANNNKISLRESKGETGKS